jgi:FkbM family methyltransferase
MKKIFLDCGGNIGLAIDRFKKSSLYSPDFIIYSFEPLPMCNKQYKDRKDIIFSDKAVWISDSYLDFYISRRHKGVGSTLKKEKFSCDPDFEHPIKVKCFDFSKWIIDNFTKEHCIILKMDIEGSEYDVLEKMISDGSIYYIKKAFIEFHFEKMTMEKKRHFDLVEKLKKIDGLELLSEFRGV